LSPSLIASPAESGSDSPRYAGGGSDTTAQFSQSARDAAHEARHTAQATGEVVAMEARAAAEAAQASVDDLAHGTGGVAGTAEDRAAAAGNAGTCRALL
jgi:hypothetical protein